jgi:sec-independent protein translocase protein TatA
MSLFALFSPETMIVVGIIALLLFGNRLPSVMRSLGQGVTEFKKGLEGTPDDGLAKKGEPAKRLDDQGVSEPAKKLDEPDRQELRAEPR